MWYIKFDYYQKETYYIMDLSLLSKETLIMMIKDQQKIIETYEKDQKEIIETHEKETSQPRVKSIQRPERQCWRLQVWWGNKNGKSQSENKRRIMEIMYEKKIHLVDLIKRTYSFDEINTHRQKQLDRVTKGDKVFMCDNKHTYYEGTLLNDYTHYPPQSMIDNHLEIIHIVWGNSCLIHNITPFIYMANIDWVKKELTQDMKTYLMKSVANGGGRIDMQGTILKLNPM